MVLLQTIGCGYWKDRTSTGFPKPYVCEHRWPEVAAMVRWRRQMFPAFTTYKADFQAGNRVMSITYPGKGFFIFSIDSNTFKCGPPFARPHNLHWMQFDGRRHSELRYPGCCCLVRATSRAAGSTTRWKVLRSARLPYNFYAGSKIKKEVLLHSKQHLKGHLCPTAAASAATRPPCLPGRTAMCWCRAAQAKSQCTRTAPPTSAWRPSHPLPYPQST